jgi:hypothetical protein
MNHLAESRPAFGATKTKHDKIVGKAMTRRKRKPTVTEVVANLPSTVELTKLNSNNSITIQIKSSQALMGTLVMGRGSVQWWPRGNRINTLRKSWKAFAAMLDKSMN